MLFGLLAYDPFRCLQAQQHPWPFVDMHDGTAHALGSGRTRSRSRRLDHAGIRTTRDDTIAVGNLLDFFRTRCVWTLRFNDYGWALEGYRES